MSIEENKALEGMGQDGNPRDPFTTHETERRIHNPTQKDHATFLETSEETGGEYTLIEVAPREKEALMTEAENFEEQTLERQRLALNAMFDGDPEPYMGMWSQRDPVSLFGAWGPCKTGWSELSKTFRWVGSRFGGGQMTYDREVAYAGEDLAYTVGYERGEVAVDGGAKSPMTLRVTQIYRREDGEWRLVHRHADYPPVDESPR